MALIGHLQVANKCRIASAILTAASSGPIPKAPGSAGGYLPPEQALRFVIDPLSLTRIDRLDGGWRVGSVNQRWWG